MFEDLAKFGTKPFRRQARGFAQQLVERGALLRRHPELSQNLLLPNARLQSAQSQIWPLLRGRFNLRRIGFFAVAHGPLDS